MVVLDSICGLGDGLRKEPFESPLPIGDGNVLVGDIDENIRKGEILVYFSLGVSLRYEGLDSLGIRHFASEIDDKLMPELGKEGIDCRMFVSRRGG